MGESKQFCRAPVIMEKSPVPIFVLGSARSGTTWLANILASHDNVAAATAVEHHGIHESHVYSYTRYCFPESVTCCHFFEQYCLEDYYRILKIDAEAFCKNKVGVHKVTRLFRMMMDDYSIRRECDFWLEKTPKHTIYFREIANDFPDCRFVAIQREFVSAIKSNLMKYPRKNVSRMRQVAEKVFRYESDRKALHCLKREHPSRVVVISYEDLVSRYDETVNKIIDDVGLGKQSLVSKYAGDSSYGNNSPTPAFSMLDLVFMLLCRLIVRSIPFSLLVKWRAKHDRNSVKGIPRSSRLLARLQSEAQQGLQHQ